MEHTDVTIVGAGFAGAMVAVQLTRLAPALRVRLYDGDGGNGRGVAYGTSSDRHLLNVPAGNMSAFPDDPDHFWNWVNGRTEGAVIERTDFVPRKTYGQYVEALLTETQKASATLSITRDRLVDIKLHAGGYELTDTQGNKFVSARVVLALGNYPPAELKVLDESARASPNYLRSPWGKDSVSRIGGNDDVLIVGSGLTAIDVLLSIEEQWARGMIHMISRRGLLPCLHQPYASSRSYFKNGELPLSIRAMTKLIRRLAREEISSGKNWRAVVDALRPHTQAYWQSLPERERRRFVRHVSPYWEAHRHRVAPAVFKVIDRLRAGGQLQLHRARLTSIVQTGSEFQVHASERGSASPLSFPVKFVINCTGPEANYRRLPDSFVKSLVRRGLVEPDSLGMGFKSGADGAVLNLEGQASSRLFAIGSPRKCTLYETIAVPELRLQARELAELLAASLI